MSNEVENQRVSVEHTSLMRKLLLLPDRGQHETERQTHQNGSPPHYIEI